MLRRSKRAFSSTSFGSNTPNSEDGTRPNKKARLLLSTETKNGSPKSDTAKNMGIGLNSNNSTSNFSSYVCNARNAIRFKFVEREEDVIDEEQTSNSSNSNGSKSGNKFFQPVYTHQLFNKEQIQGYKNLRINVYISQPHLYAYIEIKYDDKKADQSSKPQQKNCDDLLAIFQHWMKGGFTTNKETFLSQLKEKFVPVGKKHCSYILPNQLTDFDS
ncbi:hypothetical protein RFI_17139 [Reticulomyxa filosa]|uniref:histone acetyltransferase n=1 Tax=Reticulomyxa filosa TaxID=46433 RepID=X6N2E1_RETFI|nr:hypothetical protein RFI_17139 [Reticulomyxa filosa]|eukprot:ETO20078.1 hypothetical protein RFI_17139 [Reticulomyxa filosa]